MTIRELINILIDAPEKDKEVCVEYRQREVEANNDGYEWNQLEATQAVIKIQGVDFGTLIAYLYQAHEAIEQEEVADGQE